MRNVQTKAKEIVPFVIWCGET